MKKMLHHAGLIMILFLITGLFSCERLSELNRLKDSTRGLDVKKGKDKTEDPCGEPVIIRLVSTEDLAVSPANIIVTNDDEFLTVKFEVTERGWNFDMIYLQVGPLDLVPLDGDGNYPAFWDFNYQWADTPVASYTFQIPLADLDDCVNILAQARVTEGVNYMPTRSEGINPGWTEGPFATYYCVEICTGTTMGTDTGQTSDNSEN